MNRFSRLFWDHAFVHLSWIIGVLIFTIIMLFSKVLGTDSALKDTLNTALALSSVFLAMFAIIQSFFSGSTLDNLMASLRLEVNEIKQPATEIRVAAEILKGNSEKIASRADEMKSQIEMISSSTPNKQNDLFHSKPGFDKLANGGAIAIALARLSCRHSKSYYTPEIGLSTYISAFCDGYLACLNDRELIERIVVDGRHLVTKVDAIADAFVNADGDEFLSSNIELLEKYFSTDQKA